MESRCRGALGPSAVGAIAVVAILVTSATAFGQAGLEQYIPSGRPGHSPGASDPDAQSQAAGQTSSAAHHGAQRQNPAASPAPRPTSSSDTGLPAGGYPVTSFVWIVLALACIATLGGLAAKRLQARDSADRT